MRPESAVLAAVVLALGAGPALAGATSPNAATETRSATADATDGRSALQAPIVDAEINYTCRAVNVSVSPEWVQYDLVVYYYDAVTDDTGKALLGPLNGTVREPFGPEIYLTRVQVLVNGANVGEEGLPARCYPDRSADTDSSRSSSATDGGSTPASGGSRKPVPVAIATT